ncbi:hypothetical protein [Clostridium culturomicium]|uniref:hypothetical protein n=1 Tax=Clostridium culturomicium TaxID=1499683 RepID=UPI00058FC53B|nr:hypothetical protein [Clostridium culturomicium]
MKRIFTFIDELLNLCNSLFQVLTLINSRVGLSNKGRRTFLLRVYHRYRGKDFEIIIVEKRSGDHGEKTSNEF